jgi:hypothetical protein
VSNDSLNSPSHSVQHADANDAIEAIEGYLLTGAGAAGLVKIIPSGATNGTVSANGDVTIGSAVSSVAITDAYNANYDAYKIIITGGVASANVDLAIINTGSTASYAYVFHYVNYTTAAISIVNSASTTSIANIGVGTTATLRANIEVINPFLAKPTIFSANIASNNFGGTSNGFHNVSTSYTGFTITASSGTLTGGTIRIYGYK